MNCLKCQKEYIPKRVGGLFCSDSCGNSYRQKKKRDEQKKARLVEQGLAVKHPLTEGEQGLWAILSELEKTGIELRTVLNLPVGHEGRADVGPRLARFVGDVVRVADSPVVQEIRARFEVQQMVEEQIKGKQQERIKPVRTNNKGKQKL